MLIPEPWVGFLTSEQIVDRGGTFLERTRTTVDSTTTTVYVNLATVRTPLGLMVLLVECDNCLPGHPTHWHLCEL